MSVTGLHVRRSFSRVNAGPSGQRQAVTENPDGPDAYSVDIVEEKLAVENHPALIIQNLGFRLFRLYQIDVTVRSISLEIYWLGSVLVNITLCL